MDRKVWAFALVAVAACLRLGGARVADARLMLAGVAPLPWRAREAERVLAGAALSSSTPDRVAAAVAGAAPLRHNGYKAPLARALVRRTRRARLSGARSPAGRSAERLHELPRLRLGERPASWSARCPGPRS